MVNYTGCQAKSKFVEKCDALYVWHKDPLFRMALGAVGGDRIWALALLEKTMTTAYRSIDKFDSEKSERTKSIMTAILQSLINEIFLETWEKMGLTGEQAELPASLKDRFDVDQILIRNEFTAELAKYVEKLANTDRDIVFMRYFAGFPEEEIAHHLGCSLEDAESRVFKVKQKIAAMIKEG
ncbi:MAG: sigma-70 family RNA polymerase sigma factor [Clostridiales bacterium]|nr:sigma-70 family RNA polymerase sigma factor [Clostridiales bacterium]